MVTNDFPSAEGLVGPLEYDVMKVLRATDPANVPAVLDRVNASRQEDKALSPTPRS
jgi:hypothetical protein